PDRSSKIDLLHSRPGLLLVNWPEDFLHDERLPYALRAGKHGSQRELRLRGGCRGCRRVRPLPWLIGRRRGGSREFAQLMRKHLSLAILSLDIGLGKVVNHVRRARRELTCFEVSCDVGGHPFARGRSD